MSFSIPAPVIKAVLAKVAAEALPAIAAELAALGFDLGPIPPDARADFGQVDKEIDAQLDAASTPKTDPAPPPKPSEPSGL